MGFSTALMLYSKYHGILVVGFTVLSNLKLLRSPKFWLSMLLALVLFLPHLAWEYAHQFTTFQYHLEDRAAPVSTGHLFEYVSQQLLAIGPGLIFIPFVYRTQDRFERALQLICMGTFGFFLFTALKMFVHFHWTSITLFPLLLLASRYYEDDKRKQALSIPGAASGPRRRAAPAVSDVLDLSGEPHLGGLLPRPGTVVEGHRRGGR